MPLDKVLRVESHTTPYTPLPEVTSEFYRLDKVTYGRGLYRMEGVMGYDYYQLVKPITVTNLHFRNAPTEKWQSLMVDDPLHWLGMQELSSKCSGHVLVGGLGMGLILHHLVKNKDVTKITVIEIDPELTHFIKPCLPIDPRIEIIHDNFFTYVVATKEKYDCAIIDLWVLSEKAPRAERQRVGVSMLTAKELTKRISPKVFIWGVRGNPTKGGSAMDEIQAKTIAEEAAVKAVELQGQRIVEQVAKELSGEMLHSSPVSAHCEVVLGKAPKCYDFRAIRSYVLCKAWDIMEKEKRTRLPVGEAWAEARKVCVRE